MMEYDRTMLERIGGQFVVLRSRAEPGVEVCQGTMRKADVSVDDLVPAHVRAGRGCVRAMRISGIWRSFIWCEGLQPEGQRVARD